MGESRNFSSLQKKYSNDKQPASQEYLSFFPIRLKYQNHGFFFCVVIISSQVEIREVEINQLHVGEIETERDGSIIVISHATMIT